jgi:hypothetical protein
MNETLDLSRAVWFKSSFSNGQGGDCVEVATNLPGIVAVRHSKDPDGPKLVFTPGEWRAFVAGAAAGEFG